MVVTVVVLTTDAFDAADVDHSTVTFENAYDFHIDKKSGEPRRHEEDIDNDGDLDLLFHFRLGETDLTCSSTEATITGQTFDGEYFAGTNQINTVGSQQEYYPSFHVCANGEYTAFKLQLTGENDANTSRQSGSDWARH